MTDTTALPSTYQFEPIAQPIVRSLSPQPTLITPTAPASPQFTAVSSPTREATPSPPLPSLTIATGSSESSTASGSVPTTAYKLVRDFLAVRSLNAAPPALSSASGLPLPTATTTTTALTSVQKSLSHSTDIKTGGVKSIPKLFVTRRNGSRHKSTRLCALLGQYSLPPTVNAATAAIAQIPLTADWLGSLKLLAAARPTDAAVLRAAAHSIPLTAASVARASPASAASAASALLPSIRFRVTVELGDALCQTAAARPAAAAAVAAPNSDSDSDSDEDGASTSAAAAAASVDPDLMLLAAPPRANDHSTHESVIAPALIAKQLARAVPYALGNHWIADIHDSSVEIFVAVSESTELTVGLTLSSANTQKIVHQLQHTTQCELLNVCRLVGDVSALNTLYGQLLRAPVLKPLLNKTNQFGESAVLQAVRERDVSAVTALASLGAKINTTDHRGWNAVMVAAANGDYSCLEPLLKVKGITNKTFRAALTLAAAGAHTHIVRLLLQYMSRVLNLSIRKEVRTSSHLHIASHRVVSLPGLLLYRVRMRFRLPLRPALLLWLRCYWMPTRLCVFAVRRIRTRIRPSSQLRRHSSQRLQRRSQPLIPQSARSFPTRSVQSLFCLMPHTQTQPRLLLPLIHHSLAAPDRADHLYRSRSTRSLRRPPQN